MNDTDSDVFLLVYDGFTDYTYHRHDGAVFSGKHYHSGTDKEDTSYALQLEEVKSPALCCRGVGRCSWAWR